MACLRLHELSCMIVLAIYQILSRNLFSEGVVWIDPLLRTLVLWVGLTGAVVATRTDNHIRIDIFSKYFPKSILPYILRVAYLFTLSICLLIAWHAGRLSIANMNTAPLLFPACPPGLPLSLFQ